MPRAKTATRGALLASLLLIGTAGPALAGDNGNCIGQDRSDQGGFASGRAFAQALVSQHAFDRESGNPSSTGRSLANAASTNCTG